MILMLRLPAPREGVGPVQAGQDSGDVQQEAAGAGEAHEAGGRRGLGGSQPCRGGRGHRGLPHVHGEAAKNILLLYNSNSHAFSRLSNTTGPTIVIFLILGDAWSTEDQQQDGDELDAGGVPGRPQDPVRISRPSPQLVENMINILRL